MTVYLLDINVLLALSDPMHLHHEPSHKQLSLDAGASLSVAGPRSFQLTDDAIHTETARLLPGGEVQDVFRNSWVITAATLMLNMRLVAHQP